jgi:hypothetical protein
MGIANTNAILNLLKGAYFEGYLQKSRQEGEI